MVYLYIMMRKNKYLLSSFPPRNNSSRKLSGSGQAGRSLSRLGGASASRPQGFTLIEVILAMVLLTVGTLTLLSVIVGGVSQRETTREYDVARNAASTKLEEIRGYDFANVYTQYHNTYFSITELTAPTGWTDPGRIQVDNTSSDLYNITITIRWQIKGNTDSNVYNEFVTTSLLTRKTKD